MIKMNYKIVKINNFLFLFHNSSKNFKEKNILDINIYLINIEKI